MKKIIATLLTGAMALSLMACTPDSGNGGNSGVSDEKVTIGVGFYMDSGNALNAAQAYLESFEEVLNVEFKYTVLSQQDEAINLTKIQELIASGVDGIISTMDSGTPAIIDECEAANVYYGGYICDYDIAFNDSYSDVFESEYFVGTTGDGPLPVADDKTLADDMFNSVLEYNERNPEAPLTHLSMALFPDFAFPIMGMLAEQFVANIDEYNKTADVKITVDPLNEETDVLMFQPMDTTYFAKHEGVQGIISFASGSGFVYPTILQAGLENDLKLFTTGYDGGEDLNFGSNGTKTYQHVEVTAPETLTYALVLLLNEIKGVKFSDQPDTAERIGVKKLVVNSDEDLETFKNTVYYTGDAENSLLTPEEVLDLTAYGNENATYANLVEVVTNMTIDTVK